jgi:[ribosomal protein S18]-alanine N-acetyltransferase
MIANHAIRLATNDDAPRIAEMSRDLIEHGMRWKWTPASIRGCIRNAAINVAVAPDGQGLAGFAIMQYLDDEAHLMLLAVHPHKRRHGVGAALMAWHEEAALTAGLGTIYIEARAGNTAARTFYGKLGYREVQYVRGYYSNHEDGVRFAKDLWAQVQTPS